MTDGTGVTQESTARNTQLLESADDDEDDVGEIALDEEPPAESSKTGSASDLEAQPAATAEVAEEPTATYRLNKKYMKTPCNHSYHSVCLKKWMDIRLECPTCRQAIPILDDD